MAFLKWPEVVDLVDAISAALSKALQNENSNAFLVI